MNADAYMSDYDKAKLIAQEKIKIKRNESNGTEHPCLGCSVPLMEHLTYQIIQPFILIYSFFADFLGGQKAFLF